MSLNTPENYEIIVYNTDFSDANFSSNDSLKGIFTLGEENIEAENAINAASQELHRLDGNSTALTEKNKTKDDKLTALSDNIKKPYLHLKKHTKILNWITAWLVLKARQKHFINK
jgi:hypothetical protein